MAKKRGKRPTAATRAVTADRSARLCRMLRYLGGGARTRDALARHLRLDVRSFYRDLELIRNAGIPVSLDKKRYTLDEDVKAAIARLPFPDPRLTLGEAEQLAKGRTAAHTKLKGQIGQILG
jgi:hypothetical protein